MERRTLEDGTLLSVGERGESRTWVPIPGVLCQRFSGHGSLELTEAIMLDSTELIRSRDDWTFFADWYDMTGYDSAARVELTRWILSLRPHIDRFHLLLRSRMV